MGIQYNESSDITHTGESPYNFIPLSRMTQMKNHCCYP